MSEKALKAALGTLVGLLLVYVLVLLVPGSGGSVVGGDLERRLAELDQETVAAVMIRGPEDSSLELTRDGARWTVNGFRTDSAAVARFWNAVETLHVGNLIASNPANHPRLGVSADSTWTVTFRPSDGEETQVLLGKSGPGFSSVYVRLPDSDAVYLVEGGLRGAATGRLDDWRDRSIATVDTAAVWSLQIERDGALATLVRTEGGWTVNEQPADSGVVADLLTELRSLQATGFAADSVSFEGDERRHVVALDVAGDTLVGIELVGSDGAFLARATTSPTLYQLPGWRADRVIPTVADLEGSADPEGT